MTEVVRRKPYTVILLDEVEKAHPDVFNVLLQILDEGRLTDGQGRTVDFRNTVIIMTSNLGSQIIQELSGQWELMKTKALEILRLSFRPEFLNRIDEIIIFQALGKEQVRKIVDLQLQRLSARLLEKQIGLEVTPGARDLLADVGYEPAYGARPLKRAIQREVMRK